MYTKTETTICKEKDICLSRSVKSSASLNLNGEELTASMNIQKTEMLFLKQNIIAKSGIFDQPNNKWLFKCFTERFVKGKIDEHKRIVF